MNESALTKKLAARARQEPGVWIRKVWGGPQSAGWPDLVGLCRGVFLGLEVKLPGKEKTLTKLQAETLAAIRRNGGVAMVITNIGDLEYALMLAHLASYIGEYVVDPETGCHIRKGRRDERGQISIQRNGKRIRRNAPRVIAAVYHELDIRHRSGQGPNDLEACHTCDTPACINPEHIYKGTQKENMRQMVDRGRHLHVPKPGRNPKVPLGAREKILYLYHKKGWTQARIARKYGVAQTLVSNIILGKGRYGPSSRT